MATESDNNIQKVKQSDEARVMEERGTVFDVDNCEGPFRALKTRIQP